MSEELKDLVSIIVPVYNSEKFIEDTIKTVLNQTYTNWELILVDDCSKDNSKTIISKYISNKIKCIELKENSGAAIARNVGIENARGRFIAFLDSDDLWVNNKLEKQISFMSKNKYNFTFTGYEFANKYGIANGKIVKIPKTLNYNQALKNTIIWTSTVVIDTNNISKDTIKMLTVKSEDTATWWKILKNNNIAYGINEVLAYYRRTSNSLSSNKFEAIKRILNLYRNIEGLSLCKSIECFIFYAFNTVKKRI